MAARSQLDAVFACFVATRAPELLATVFEATADRLLSRARRLVEDPGLAEDLVQETFLVVAERANGFDAERACLPYLLGILSWRAWRARGSRRDGEPLLDGLTADEPAPLERAIDREAADAVARTIATLPRHYAEVLEPYLFERCSPCEIAAQLGRPAATVRVQVHRGLRALRDALPAGLAGLLCVLTPQRGVAARVRDEAARPMARRADEVGLLRGGRFAASIAIPMLLAVAIWALRSPVAAEASSDDLTAVRASSIAGAAAPRIAVDRSAPRLVREPVAAPVAMHGSLRLDFVWEDGTPASGIGVRVVAVKGADPLFGELRRVVDAGGRLRVGGLAPGDVRVVLDRGAEVVATVRSADDPARLVTLGGGVRVEGRVVDVEGRAVPGAGIWVCDRPRHPWEGQVVTHADVDGCFELRGMQPMMVVAATGDARAPSRMEAVGEAACQSLSLVMPGPGARLRGIVVDARGDAVEGAVVLAGVAPRSEFLAAERSAARWPPNARTTSDAEGRFDFRGLPVGPLRVVARSRDHVTAAVDVEVRAGEAETLRVPLQRGVVVTGRVVDAAGAAVADAHVQVEGSERWQWASATTDVDGRFALSGLDPQRTVVWVEADGRAPLRRVLAAGERLGCRLVVAAPARVGARLLDADGRPLPAHAVCAGTPSPRWAAAEPPVVRTGSDGCFEFERRPEATHLFVCDPASGVWVRVAQLDEIGGGDDVVVPRAAMARGVVALRLRNLGFEPSSLLLLASRDGWTYAVQSEIDVASGSLRSGALPVGEYRFRLHGEDGNVPPVELGTHAVRAEEVLQLGERDVAAGTLRFSFRSADGVELRQLAAWVVPAAGESIPLRGSAGEQALLPGVYRVRARTGEHLDANDRTVTVRAGEVCEVAIVLQPARAREVRFELPAAAAGEARCRLIAPGECVVLDDVLVPDVDGRFAFRAVLGRGLHRLEVESDGELFRAEVEVADARDGATAIALRPMRVR